MLRFALLTAALLVPLAALADDQEAKDLAQETLNKGAALFDARDAQALAASYTEDAEITIIGKDQGSGTFKTQAIRGRQAIENGYQDFFKNAPSGTVSKNTVEFAHFIRPGLMAIHGQFQPDTSKAGEIPFIQVRVKEGEQWRLMSLQLFVLPE